MKPCARERAGARDVARVLRYARFNKNNIQFHNLPFDNKPAERLRTAGKLILFSSASFAAGFLNEKNRTCCGCRNNKTYCNTRVRVYNAALSVGRI